MREGVEEHGLRRSATTSGTPSLLGSATSRPSFPRRAAAEPVVEVLNELDESRGTQGNRVYYLAIPPKAMETTVEQVGRHRTTGGWTRLIVEKPFGHDAASARALNDLLTRALRRAGDLPHRPLPRQGDRPEHARAAVRKRDLRADLEPTARRPRADHGVPSRSASRAAPGSTSRPARSATSSRTTCSSCVALTAMEPPIDFTADSVRNEKVKVLRAIHTPGPKHVVRGQYGAGLRGGPGGSRVSPGARGGGRLDDRNLRRSEALHRQLALGGHAVLPAHRKAAAAP